MTRYSDHERRARRVIVAIAVLGTLAAIAMAGQLNKTDQQAMQDAAYTIDGDTLEIDGERIRLNGIDAPEMRNSPYGAEARVELAWVLTQGEVTFERIKQDRYGRTVAQAWVGLEDLSCHMLRTGHAVYVRKWDEGGRTRKTCPQDSTEEGRQDDE